MGKLAPVGPEAYSNMLAEELAEALVKDDLTRHLVLDEAGTPDGGQESDGERWEALRLDTLRTAIGIVNRGRPPRTRTNSVPVGQAAIDTVARVEVAPIVVAPPIRSWQNTGGNALPAADQPGMDNRQPVGTGSERM